MKAETKFDPCDDITNGWRAFSDEMIDASLRSYSYTVKNDCITTFSDIDHEDADNIDCLEQAPALAYRPFDTPHDKFLSRQKWIGTVVRIDGEEFVARLHDITNSGPDEETTLFLADVSSDDRALIELGAEFYLNIGYKISVAGQRTRGLTIRFRRLPNWDADEVLDAHRRAKARLGRIRCE
jgi:hypothetical protein